MLVFLPFAAMMSQMLPEMWTQFGNRIGCETVFVLLAIEA